jgi:hypothetical protein
LALGFDGVAIEEVASSVLAFEPDQVERQKVLVRKIARKRRKK